MYTISDVMYLGQAHELVLSEIKCDPVVDDFEPSTLTCEEFFD